MARVWDEARLKDNAVGGTPAGASRRAWLSVPPLAGLLGLAVLAAGCGYSVADVDRAVMDPRAGRVLHRPATRPGDMPVNGVAIVYSAREALNLKAGWEKYDPRDLGKGRLIYRRLVETGAIRPEDVFVPAPAGDDALLAVHDKRYLDSLSDRWLVSRVAGSDYPLWQSQADHDERIVGGHRTMVGGTMLAAELAAAHGLAIHLGGGCTNAFSDRGGNGCLLADVPAAVAMLRQLKLARKIMVIDLGATQANGVAAALANDPDAFLLDIYEASNYPPVKQPEGPGGIAIPDGLGDGEYRLRLDQALTMALDSFRPELVIYVAGVDVAAGDPRGHSALTPGGILARDLFVAEQVRGRKIPLCVLLGGGSAQDSWLLHYRTIRGLLARYAGVPFRMGQ